LQDLREYRERNLAQVQMSAIFPIWKRDTRELAQEFCAVGFRAIAVCIDSKKLSREFAGRELDESFFRDLPAGVDHCGENGEFHTFVYDGPIFSNMIPVERGEVIERDGFYFCDLKEKSQ
jgi:diphthamide synthase (EF-2-diphthine--ammonia ligase)